MCVSLEFCMNGSVGILHLSMHGVYGDCTWFSGAGIAAGFMVWQKFSLSQLIIKYYTMWITKKYGKGP